HDSTGPMLLKIEDLSGEEDASAETNGADRMECYAECAQPIDEESSRDMEPSDHREHQQEPLRRRELIPMRRDEQKDSSGQHRGAKDDGEQDHPVGLSMRCLTGFIFTNTIGRGEVDDARVYPALEVRIDLRVNRHDVSQCKPESDEGEVLFAFPADSFT